MSSSNLPAPLKQIYKISAALAQVPDVASDVALAQVKPDKRAWTEHVYVPRSMSTSVVNAIPTPMDYSLSVIQSEQGKK